MKRTIIDGISIISFLAFLSGAGGLTYVWLNQDSIKQKIINEVTKSLPIPKDLPKLPTSTGPALPF